MDLAYNIFYLTSLYRSLYCIATMNSLTKSYRFDAMAIGDSLVIRSRFQHARVAASEYAKRHNVVFTCRMQPEVDGEPRTMIIYRVGNDQRPIDQRGRNSHRSIPAASGDPTQAMFEQWLAGFAPGQQYSMPSQYSHMFLAMQAWCQVFSLTHRCIVIAERMEGTLLITRSA